MIRKLLSIIALLCTHRSVMLLLTLFTTATAWADDIVITSENFNDYFEYNGDFEYPSATPNQNIKGGYFLKDDVSAESTLDFLGAFIPDASGTYNPRIFINKRVNITSSEKTAVFKPYTEDKNGEPVEKYWWTFGILEGADYTVVENLRFENCWVFNHGSSYVTFDGIDMKVQNARIGSGQGGLTILTPDNGGHAVDHTTVKNSSFYCMNSGATSCIIAGHGAPYATFDHNTITLEGNVGNGIYASIFNSNGSYPYPEFATFTNNVITGPASASMFCWCIVVCGQGNLVEGNTINYVGNAIYTASGSPSLDDTSAKNTYRNNTTTLGGSMSVHNYSVVENNQVSGQLTLTKGATATGNTVGIMTVSGQDVTAKNNTVNSSMTISGANATFQNNTVNGDVTISKTTASFTDNAIYGTLTLNSASNSANDNNTITGNVILSSGDNAAVLNSSNNTVSGNILTSANLEGDDAVKTTKTNTIEDNTLAAYEAATASSQSNAPFIITNETTTLKAGDGAGTFYYVPTGATVTINGTLTITPNEGATSPKVNLFLGDDSQLNVGTISGNDCSLTIYGKIYDGTGACYTGTLTGNEITTIAGKSLRSYDYRSGNVGSDMTWELTDEDNNNSFETLTISGTGAMADFSSKDDQPWKDNRDNIATVVIKNGVTSIGGNAFYGCSSLTSVTVCATACTLGNGAFDGCASDLKIYVFSDKVNYYKSAENWSDYASNIEAILFQLTKKNAGTESESITYYTTLGDAVNAAADGDKITLLDDYTITVSTDNVTTDTRGVSINKSITLDLNDHKITRVNPNEIDDYGGALISIYSRIDARTTLTLVDNGANKGTMGSIENIDVHGGYAIVVGNGSKLIAKGVMILTPDRDTVDIDDDGEAEFDDCVIHGKVGINLRGTATITNSDISGGNASAIQVGGYDGSDDVIREGCLTIGYGVYISGFTSPGIDYQFGTVILKALPTFGQNRPTTSSTTRAKARAKTREGEIPYDIGMRPGLSLTFEEGTFETPGQPMRIYIKDNDRPVDPATYTNPITTNYSKYVKDGGQVINPNDVFKWKENDFTRGFRQNTDEVIFDHAAATVTSYSGTTTPYYAYYDFSEAIAAANSGYKTASDAGGTEFIPTLKMLEDVSYDASVVIGDGSTVTKVTLDLNDHELKSNCDAGTITVKNQATLSLVDTGTDPNKKGTIVCSNSNGYAIHNEGTADINGCDLSAKCGIYSNNTATIANCAINATTYGIYEDNGTTTVGEGVSFSGNREASIYKHPGTLTLTAWPTFGGSETEGYADIKLSSGRAVTFSGIGLGAQTQNATLRTVGSSGSETATLTFTPNTGYVLNTVDYNNTVITPENGAYTFTMPDADVTITATWKIQTKISLNEPPSGYYFYVLDEVGTGATLTNVVSSTPVTDENVTLTYTSSNEDVAKVVNGKIQALAEGTATITVSFDGNDKYAAAESKTIDLTIVYPTMTVTLPAGLSTYYGNAGVRVSDSQADGVKMYAVTDVSGDQVTLKQLPSRTVPANTPVIISNTGSEALDCQFEYALNDAGKAQFASTLASDLGVANAEAISSALAPAFVGTAEAIEAYVPANGATLYGLNGAAFVRLDAKPNIPANRCWLEIGGTTAGTRSLSIVFDDSGTTGIKAVHGDDDDSWYTIDGRKLDQAPSRKGLYIRGGRKVVRK